MAIILEGSDHSPVMWGKIGNYLICRNNMGTMYLREYIIPFDPNTIAQQNIREAFREGSLRWKNFEKVNSKEYWSDITLKHNFVHVMNAFISSFIITYGEKVLELGSHTLAINYVKNTSNTIIYKESLYKINKEKQGKNKISAVLTYQKTKDYQQKLASSIKYLKDKDWLTKTKYGIIPYIDSFLEEKLRILKVVPSIGGFGSGLYGKGTFGTSR